MDGSLMKDELSSFLRSIAFEYCLYGFMISADVDRNFAVDQEEWFEAFKLFGKRKIIIYCLGISQ